jgi:AcrR family transcriptional regulator
MRAAQELLLDVGYAGLSMDVVAARAGVSKPAIYRRYPSKGALVFAAVFGKTMRRDDPDSGSLTDDLKEAYSWAVEEFSAPEAIAALPGLMADLTAHPQLAALVRGLVVEPEYERVRTMLERAQQRGEIRQDVDLTLVIDAFTGTGLTRVLLLDRPVDRDFGERLVDLIVYGLAPRDPR